MPQLGHLRLSRRSVVRAAWGGAALGVVAPLIQACGAAPPAAEKVVEKPVERVVTQVVEKPVEKVVTQVVVVTATPAASASKPQVRQLKLSTDWNAGVRKRIMDAVKAEHEKSNPNVKIEHWHMGDGGTSGPGGYTDIVVAQLATGTAADVIMEVAYVPHVQYFVEIGPDLASLGWKKDEHILVENPGPILDGKQYGVPINTVITGWVYNEDLFAKDGVKPPTADWTFEDMFTAARALTKPAERQFGVHARDFMEWGWGHAIWPEGAGIVSADGSKMLLCEGGAPDAFQWYADLTFKHKVSPNPAETSSMMTPGLFEPFASGKIAMAPAGVYLIGFLQDNIGQRFKMALMPTPKSPRTGKRAHFLGQAVAVIPKVSQERGNYEEALKYAAFFTSDFTQKMYAEQRPSAPSSKKWLQSPEYSKAPPANMDLVWKNYSGGADDLIVRYNTARPGGQEALIEARKHINTAFTGDAPDKAKQILMEACAKGNDIIAKAKR